MWKGLFYMSRGACPIWGGLAGGLRAPGRILSIVIIIIRIFISMNVLIVNIIVVIYYQAVDILTISTISLSSCPPTGGKAARGRIRDYKRHFSSLVSIDKYIEKHIYTLPSFICYLPTTIFFFFLI